MFRKQLSSRQWVSLCILTVGCMVHAAGTGTGDNSDNDVASSDLVHLGLGGVFILVQVLCSVIAGVYNEFIIKGDGADIHIMIQNVFMYLDSILCNIVLLSAKVSSMQVSKANL